MNLSDIITSEDAKLIRQTTSSTSQILTGFIAKNLTKMGVIPSVISFASRAGPNEVNYPSFYELQEANVVTSAGFGTWFIESFKNDLVAASRESNPITPAQQITTYCRRNDGKKS